MELLNGRANGVPELRLVRTLADPNGQWSHRRNAHRDQIRRVERAASPVSRRCGSRHVQALLREPGEQAPLDERTGPVCAREDVAIVHQFADQPTANVVTQDELPWHVTDEHRATTPRRAKRPRDRLSVQPTTRDKAVLAYLTDNGPVVKDRPSSGFFDGFGQRLRPGATPEFINPRISDRPSLSKIGIFYLLFLEFRLRLPIFQRFNRHLFWPTGLKFNQARRTQANFQILYFLQIFRDLVCF